MAGGTTDFDVLIVGAGISGIGMAAHLGEKLPELSYAIIEQRSDIGGTWDLFRYPGIRTDSDMHTFSYAFEPWRSPNRIVSAADIKTYLGEVIDKRDIRRRIRFGHKLVAADFRHEDARWHVTTEAEGETRHWTANWLFMGTGYYDYDEPHDPGFDFSGFSGQVVHPQFWPHELDYAGKRVVVIGSGATAVTIIPVMAQKAQLVTMLQRTPTWYFSIGTQDKVAQIARKVLPEDVAHKLIRWRNIRLLDFFIRRCREKPDKVRQALTEQTKEALGTKYTARDFSPPYNPWEQRLCFMPDNDLFEAIGAGRADVVTGQIATFEADGIRLHSGELITADIIIPATGLKLVMAGKTRISVEGEPVNFAEHFYYKGCMFSNVPNFSTFFGYTNASWTLRVDIVAEYLCRVFRHMQAMGADIVTPVLPDNHGLQPQNFFNLDSNYIKRAQHILPKNGPEWPWQLGMDYLKDRKQMKATQVVDGILAFENTDSGAMYEAAE